LAKLKALPDQLELEAKWRHLPEEQNLCSPNWLSFFGTYTALSRAILQGETSAPASWSKVLCRALIPEIPAPKENENRALIRWVVIRANVRFGSLADIGQPIRDVRFTPDSRHSSAQVGCPLCAKSGPHSAFARLTTGGHFRLDSFVRTTIPLESFGAPPGRGGVAYAQCAGIHGWPSLPPTAARSSAELRISPAP
jgi:hypothetical protein